MYPIEILMQQYKMTQLFSFDFDKSSEQRPVLQTGNKWIRTSTSICIPSLIWDVITHQQNILVIRQWAIVKRKTIIHNCVYTRYDWIEFHGDFLLIQFTHSSIEVLAIIYCNWKPILHTRVQISCRALYFNSLTKYYSIMETKAIT